MLYYLCKKFTRLRDFYFLTFIFKLTFYFFSFPNQKLGNKNLVISLFSYISNTHKIPTNEKIKSIYYINDVI